MPLPEPPAERENPWFEKRNAFDNAVRAELDGRLSEAGLSATIDGSRLARSSAALVAQTVPKVAQVPTGLGEVPIPLHIIRTRSGFITNVDPLSRHSPASGPTYFVDPINGSNSNDGLTEGTAFQTPAHATTRGGGHWAELVFVESGTFDRTAGLFGIGKGCTVRTLPGVKVKIICGDKVTWTANGAAWSASIATCNGVIDDGYFDALGDPTPLLAVDSVAEVQATPGTYYFDSGTVTARLSDDRTPDLDVYVGRVISSVGWHASVAGDDGSAYLEGVEWWGGTTANFTPPGNGWRLYAKNCGFNAAGSTNGISIWGLAETILVGCHANHNKLDGFNYTDNNGRTGFFLEVNCSGRNNGISGGSNNGSTSHGNYRGIRVGCDYYDNQGANVADVGNAKSYNVGVVAGGSTDYKQDFYTDSEMWVDGCLSSSETGLFAAGGGVIHERETAVSGDIVGTVSTY